MPSQSPEPLLDLLLARVASNDARVSTCALDHVLARSYPINENEEIWATGDALWSCLTRFGVVLPLRPSSHFAEQLTKAATRKIPLLTGLHPSSTLEDFAASLHDFLPCHRQKAHYPNRQLHTTESGERILQKTEVAAWYDYREAQLRLQSAQGQAESQRDKRSRKQALRPKTTPPKAKRRRQRPRSVENPRQGDQVDQIDLPNFESDIELEGSLLDTSPSDLSPHSSHSARDTFNAHFLPNGHTTFDDDDTFNGDFSNSFHGLDQGLRGSLDEGSTMPGLHEAAERLPGPFRNLWTDYLHHQAANAKVKQAEGQAAAVVKEARADIFTLGVRPNVDSINEAIESATAKLNSMNNAVESADQTCLLSPWIWHTRLSTRCGNIPSDILKSTATLS